MSYQVASNGLKCVIFLAIAPQVNQHTCLYTVIPFISFLPYVCRLLRLLQDFLLSRPKTVIKIHMPAFWYCVGIELSELFIALTVLSFIFIYCLIVM